MADATSVSYTGNIDVGLLLGNIARANPDSPFIKDFFQRVAEPLIDKLKDVKVEGLRLDLHSLFGVSPQLSSENQREFKKATKAILKVIQTQISKISDIRLTDFNLNSLIGVTPEFNRETKKQYQLTVQNLLKKIRSTTQQVQLEGFNLGMLFNSTPQLNTFNKIRFQSVISNILTRIGKQAKNLQLNTNLELSDLLGTAEFSKWTKLKYQSTIRSLLSKISKLNLTKIVQDKINTSLLGFKKIDLSELIKGKVNVSLPNQEKRDNTFVSDFDQTYNVVVTDFSSDAIHKLKKSLGLKGDDFSNLLNKPKTPEVITDKIAEEGWLSWLLKKVGTMLLSGGIGLGLIGAAAFDMGPLKGAKKFLGRLIWEVSKFMGRRILKVFQWMEGKLASLFRLNSLDKFLEDMLSKEGSKLIEKLGFKEGLKTLGSKIGFKGIEKLLGNKNFAKLGEKFFAKFLGKTAIKKIPIIGLLAGLGFGFQRALAGDWIGGLLEVASGIASLEPGAGTAISLAIDLVLAGRDIKTGGSEEVGKNNTKIKSFMGDIWDYIKKYSPLHSLIDLGSGLWDILNGNFKTGFKKIISSTTGLLNPFSGLLAFFENKNEEYKKTDGPAWIPKSGFIDNIISFITQSAPFKWISNVGSGINDILSGNFTKGLKELSNAFPIFSTLNDLVSATINIPDLFDSTVSSVDNFFENIAKSISDKIKTFLDDSYHWLSDHLPSLNPLDWFKSKDKQNIVSSATSAINNISSKGSADIKLSSTQLDMIRPIDNKDSFDEITDVLTGGNSMLATMSKSINLLVNEVRKSNKGLDTIASNTESTNAASQVNNFNQGGNNRKPIFETSVRDPAYEQRGKVWERLKRS